ncbi:ABC transporter permease [Clostridium sp. 'deep sea']|nr:ABC transporter permease [Clostridium sp. 'deep sea']
MNYILKRSLSIVFILLFVSIITFLVFEVIPGDPVLSKLGIDADEAQVEALRKELGLDRPLTIRYVEWITKAIKGDLGTSIRFERPVMELIKNRLGLTALITAMSLFFIIIIGFPLGILITKNENKFGFAMSLLSQIGMAIPSFWLGIIITYIFGLVLKLFIPGQYVSFAEDPTAAFTYLFFAVLAIAIPKISVIIRYLRDSILEQKNQDYIRTARSKGANNNYIMYIHVLRNALLPVITVLGMLTASVLGGSLIVEKVFNIPGIGRLLILAVANRDLPLVEGIVLYIAAIVVLLNFVVDLLYRVIDPRIKLS